MYNSKEHSTQLITRTVLFPVPTEYQGDEQDDFEVGIATYVGPRYLRTRWMINDPDPQPWAHGIWDSEDPSGLMPCPIDCVEVILDAEEYPLHALMLYGAEYAGEIITVSVGPETDPDAEIMDPLSLTEAIEPRSCGYDVNTHTWKEPQFKQYCPAQYDWDLVRETRNKMLEASDAALGAPDLPDSIVQPWVAYRQKLRDMPADWAGVGTSTYLIQWPFDPKVSATRKTKEYWDSFE